MTRDEYLAWARRYVLTLGARFPHRLFTVNDVRDKHPPPEGVDPRIMGRIFTSDHWVKVDYVPSGRAVNNNRPIARFRRFI